MINLKERKVQIETLITNLQEELNIINTQLDINDEKEGNKSVNVNGTTCIIDGDYIRISNKTVELNYSFDLLFDKTRKYVKRSVGEINGKLLEEANPKNQWKVSGRKRLTEKEFEAILSLENELNTFGLTLS